MERLLTFQQTGGVDVALLDEIIKKMNTGNQVEVRHSHHLHLVHHKFQFTFSILQRQQAQAVLTSFQDHADAWVTADKILEGSNVIETKYFALQVRNPPHT
jgi:hypothetical protein